MGPGALEVMGFCTLLLPFCNAFGVRGGRTWGDPSSPGGLEARGPGALEIMCFSTLLLPFCDGFGVRGGGTWEEGQAVLEAWRI